MRMTCVWLVALLLAAGCSREDSAPRAGTASGARPRDAAPDSDGADKGTAYGSRQAAVGDEAAGRRAADRADGPTEKSEAGSGIPYGPSQEREARRSPADSPTEPYGGESTRVPKEGENEQAAGEPGKESTAGTAIRSLGESFLRALGRAALGGGQPQTREPPPAEDDPFPEGEPPESDPEEEPEAP